MGIEQEPDDLNQLVVDTLVTWRCNLRCPKCCVPKEGFEASLQQFTDFFAKLRATGVHRVVLTGGDPLVRTDIGEITKSAKEAGLDVYLSTNGALLKERWTQVGPHLSWVSISLDAPTPESNEVMTGAGGANQFRKIMDFLEYYGQAPKTAKIKLASVITRVNKDGLLKLGQLVYRDHKGHRPEIWRLYQFSNQFSESTKDIDPNEYVARNSVTATEAEAIIAQLKAAFPEIEISYRPAESRDESFIFVSPDLTLTYPSGSRYITFGDSKKMGPDELQSALMSVRRIWAKIIRNRQIYT